MHYLFLFLLTLLPALAFELPAASTQCVVGIADAWDSSKVTLRLYTKTADGWKPTSEAWQGRLGKSGLAWGLGLHPVPSGVTPKKEGDNRSPAGVFPIGGAWGVERTIKKNATLPYRQVTSRDLWVEDSASAYYNQHLVLTREPATAWEKSQQMKQNDPCHTLKLFIAHNPPPKAKSGAGSAIFFHIWRADGAKPTSGCTTMRQEKLLSLIAQIDPARKPLYILLPATEYKMLKKTWRLP